MYTQVRLDGRKEKRRNDSERDESTDGLLQCKKQYPCTPHSTLPPAMAIPMHQVHANPCNQTTETNDAIIKSLNPQPYCGEKWV